MFKKYFYILASILVVAACSAYVLMSRAAEGEDITISSNTTWNAGTYTYRDIIVTNNATLTLNGSYTTDTNGAGVIINARTVTVNSGSFISANGKGYAASAGTGKGAPTGNFGSGAGYGGAGGSGDTGTAGGIVYGSAIKPLDLGSGGGNSGGGGAGGGAINLNLTGNLVLGGTISANGNNVGGWSGCGSGGSIYIVATDMSGAGTISANGGSVSGNADGGGGRIALYYTGAYSLDPTKVLASNGGAATDGSVFVFDKTNKDLTVSKNIKLNATEGLDLNGNPTTDGVFNLRNLTVTNSSTLTVGSKYTTDTDGSGIDFRLTGNLTVNTGAKIDAKGQGYAIGYGEGKGAAIGTLYGGGGSHGGSGGVSEGGSLGGTKYDSTLFPAKLGSGGIIDGGGSGGGIIKISANQILVDGSLDASANAAIVRAPKTASGGGGGTVYIKATSVSGAGTILANGGNAVGYSGGGGGGRVAIYADTSAFTASNITAIKGLKGGAGACTDGTAGTVFLYDTVSGNVTASSDVTFEATQGVSRDGTARSDGVFYFNNLTVTNNATVTVGGTFTNDSDGRGVTINLDGTLTVDAGAKITATGQGYTGTNGPGKGAGGSSTSGSGGSYGGVGGSNYNLISAGPIYGATEANYPHMLGSGGGAGASGIGGAGGGAVTLRVLGDVVINGSVSVDGASGTGGISGWKPGAGSGGSLFLIGDTISGGGTISADGGDAPGFADWSPGAGGGGRLSLVYTTARTIPLANISATGGTAAATPTRDGAEGSVNITQRILPTATFALKNPNNDSTEFTNTTNVEIVPADGAVEKYKDAASVSELVPTFYADGWANVADGKDVGATEGSKTVRAWFKDGNELISSSVGSATITLDTTNPSLTILNNDTTTTSSQAPAIFTIDDSLSGVDYVTVGGVRHEISSLELASETLKPSKSKVYAAETSYTINVDLEVGPNSIEIGTYDKAGNVTLATFTATREAVAVVTPPATTNTPTTTGDNTSTSSATPTTSVGGTVSRGSISSGDSSAVNSGGSTSESGDNAANESEEMARSTKDSTSAEGSSRLRDFYDEYGLLILGVLFVSLVVVFFSRRYYLK
ncbi:MAG: hypothetical protein WCG99_03315 [Candidatus Berkelbacteria bacterium]